MLSGDIIQPLETINATSSERAIRERCFLLTSTNSQSFFGIELVLHYKILITNLHIEKNSQYRALVILTTISRIRHNNMRKRKLHENPSSHHNIFNSPKKITCAQQTTTQLGYRGGLTTQRSQLLLFENSKVMTKWPNFNRDYDFTTASWSKEGLFIWIY